MPFWPSWRDGREPRQLKPFLATRLWKQQTGDGSNIGGRVCGFAVCHVCRRECTSKGKAFNASLLHFQCVQEIRFGLNALSDHQTREIWNPRPFGM
jgi:hypothetical protein